MHLDRSTDLVRSFELFQSLIGNLTLGPDAEANWNEDYVEVRRRRSSA